MNSNQSTTDDEKIWQIVLGFSAYPAVFVTYDLNIFEHLAKNPLSIKNLCYLLNIDERPMEALIYTNISLGFMKIKKDLIDLTKISKKYLIKASPTSFCPLLDMLINNPFIGSISNLKSAVLNNQAQTYAKDENVFEKHKNEKQKAKSFTQSMHSIAVSTAIHWINTIDLSKHKTLLDIGGGSGAHSLCALEKWPHLSAILFEIDSVTEAAKDIMKKTKKNNRMSFHVGDMWQSPFPNTDLHFYSQIFHDWPPEKCQFLAQKSFESLPKGGRILIHELLYHDDKTGPFYAAASSVGMLLWTEGKQYSGKELKDILAKVGFQEIKVHKTTGLWQIVDGTKI